MLMILLAFAISNCSTYPDSASPDDDSQAAELDCGTMTLSVLLNLSGRRASFDEVSNSLSSASDHGHSLLDLQEVATRFGLHTTGYQWQDHRSRPNKPCISLVRNFDGSGHFILLNPVGRSGTLVQIVDPPLHPRIVDFADLAEYYDWTGEILMPSPGVNPWIVCLSLLAGVVGALLGIRAMWGRLTKRTIKHAKTWGRAATAETC